MGGCVSWHTLDTAADINQPTHLVVGDIHRTQFFVVKCIVDACAVRGNQLCNRVNGAVRHAECPARITDGSTGRKSTEGDNLCHTVLTVLTLHIINDLFTPIIAEVNVEIGHRNTLRVQKSFKEQVVCNRVDIGDADAEGNKASGSRASAGSDGNIAILRKRNEVADYKEVGVKAHAIYNRKLVFKSVNIDLSWVFIKIKSAACNPFLKSAVSVLTELVLVREVVLRSKVGQVQTVKFKVKIALFCDFYRVIKCGGHIREKNFHFLTRLEVKLIGGKALGSAVGDNGICLDAHQGCLGIGILLFKVVDIVSCDEGYSLLFRNDFECHCDLSLLGDAVVLHLEVKVLAKYITHFDGGIFRLGHATREDKLRDFSANTSRKCDKTLVMLSK